MENEEIIQWVLAVPFFFVLGYWAYTTIETSRMFKDGGREYEEQKMQEQNKTNAA